MRALLLVTGTVAALLGLMGPSRAVPIAAGSEVSINGSDNFTASSITFTSAGNVGGSQGDFTILPNCTNCVTMTASTVTSAFSGLLYSISDAGNSSTMTLDAGAVFTPGGTAQLPDLSISGTGTLTLTGRDPTPGSILMTTQGSTNELQVTFSATSIPTGVPEPASLAILGSGLLALAGLRRRWL